MIRRPILRTTLGLFGLSFFLYCFFRDFGCGKAISFDGFFRQDQHSDLPASTFLMYEKCSQHFYVTVFKYPDHQHKDRLGFFSHW
jgi:hypothetical protein